MEEVAEWLGGLDTVVNNAGVMLLGPALRDQRPTSGIG